MDTTRTTTVDRNTELVEQLDWHWRSQLRPRLDGLTDDEYLWDPARGAWSVRPRGTATAPIAAGRGNYTIVFALPEPDPAPVTTIAWRIGHVVVGVLVMRAAAHFGGPAMDHESHEYAGDAATALAHLDASYAAWTAGVRELGDEGSMRLCGPAEGPYAEASMAALVLHINRR